MKKQKLLILTQIGLGLIGLSGIVWFLYQGFKLVWVTLSSVNPSLAVGIIAAASTIIVSLATVLISKHLEQMAFIKNQQRDKKIPIYEEIIAFFIRIAKASKDGKNMPTEEEITDFMFNFLQKLLTWGSDDVVVAFSKFRNHAQNQENVLLAVEGIWIAIRKDLGHKNKDISKGTLLSLIINDIDKFIDKT